MAKYDIKLARTFDGWAVTGFLPPDLGAKFTTVLASLAVPREAGDDRSPSERRMEGLETLVDGVLAQGLPSEGHVKPQIHVVVEQGKPFELEDFGPIGPALVGRIACEAEIVTHLVDSEGKHLDMGRRARYATTKQARAVRFRQRGRCACCRHRIAEVHHTEFWSHGGRTDLDLLIGLCTKCHTLVHQSRIGISGTYSSGWIITNARGRPLARAG